MKKKSNVLGDEIGFIELVDHMGSDLTIVNSARVSFGSRSDWEYETHEEIDFSSRVISTWQEPVGLKKKDKELIKYLAENKHWSPFRHVMFQFHVKAPEIVGRQFYKHVIGSDYTFKDHAWNEISGRYKVLDNEFYIPREFRAQSKDNKQASEGIVNEQKLAKYAYDSIIEKCYEAYQALITIGVCKEQARGVLPVSFYTEWYWTASLQAVANFLALRDHNHAQWEIRQYALAMGELAANVVPEGLQALIENMK